MVWSWEEVTQEIFLVDLAHLIPWHLLHQLQACGDGVGCHVLPAINTDVYKVKTVYCREEDKHRLNSDRHAQEHITLINVHTRGMGQCTSTHKCNKKKIKQKRKNNCKTKASPVAE